MSMLQSILMITSRADIGGGPKHLLDLIKGIKKLSPKTKIIVAAPQNYFFSNSLYEESHSFLPISHRKFSFYQFFRILIYCRENNIQIIHSHGRGAGLYSRLLGLFGLKIIHTFHGAHNEKSFIGKAKISLDQLLKHLTHRFIHVSSDEKEQALDLSISVSELAHIIPNGVNVTKISQNIKDLDKSKMRKKYSLPQDKIVIGTLARLTYQKGLDLLLKMDLPVQFIFAIAGFGEDESILKDELKKKNIRNIILLGKTEEPLEFLGCLDAYFSSSRWEGLPLGVLEAMSASLPCFLSSVTGHHDLANGSFLYPLKNPEALGEIIQQTEFKKAGIKAYEFVSMNHTVEKMSEQTLGIYRHL